MNINTIISTLDNRFQRTLRTCGRYDYGNVITYTLNNAGVIINGTQYTGKRIYLLPKTTPTLAIHDNSITQIPINEINTLS